VQIQPSGLRLLPQKPDPNPEIVVSYVMKVQILRLSTALIKAALIATSTFVIECHPMKIKS
jgi:hypothetical protein